MVVQKFGGTSVADPDAVRRLIEIARAARTRDGRGPVVVVSALSGVTDALLLIAAEAGAARLERALSHVERCATGTSPWRGPWCGATDGRAHRASSRRSSISWPPSSRRSASCEKSRPARSTSIAAMGELLSSRIVAAALVNAGPARRMGRRPAAIVTDDDHTRACR